MSSAPFEVSHTVVTVPQPRFPTPEPHQITATSDAPQDIQIAMDSAVRALGEELTEYVFPDAGSVKYDRNTHTLHFVTDGVPYKMRCKVVRVVQP